MLYYKKKKKINPTVLFSKIYFEFKRHSFLHSGLITNIPRTV